MKSQHVVLTVICPCYNSADTLGAQLDALARQVCPVPWELILVDNGSTDATLEVVEAFRHRFERFRVIVNTGLRTEAGSTNLAAEQAAGRHLVMVHADDEVAPGYLAAMHEALERHPVVGAKIDEETLNPPHTRVRVNPIQHDRLGVVDDFLPIIVGASLGIRRDLFLEHGGYDPAAAPLIDVDLSWRLQLAGHDLRLCEGAVLRYRFRETVTDTFRQKRAYAMGDVLLARRFRPAGLPRRAPVTTLRGWSAALTAVLRIRDRRSALLAADLLGGAVGRLLGSWKYRYTYL